MVAPTCKDQGYTLRSCSCGSAQKINYTDPDPSKHTFGEPLAEYRATCLANGYIVRICSTCQAESDRVPEEATGHKWIAATCTAAQSCEVCQAVGEPALGHEYGETPISEKAPKCTEAGSKTYQCIHEGCTKQSVETVAATGHTSVNWDGGITERLVEGTTCQYVNVETGHCTACSTIVTRESALFYKHVEQMSVTKANTCTTKGEKVYTCQICSSTLRTETIAIDPTAHVWNGGESSADGATTVFSCTEDGCEATKVKYNENTATLNVKEVSAVEVGGATISPDEATKAGLADNVTLSVDTKTVDELVENSNVNIDQTLAERIGESPVYDLSMTAGDNKITEFGGSVTVRVPYTLEDGADPENIVVWFINDNGEIEAIPATYENGFAVFSTTHFSYYTVTRMTAAERCALYGHNYVGEDDVVITVDGVQITVKGTHVPATCVSGGYDITVCSRCGEKTSNLNPVAALGHAFEKTVTNPTCTVAGREHYECSRCDASYNVTLKATGHKWHAEEESLDGVNGKKDRYVAPTCTAKGEHYIVCTKCNAEYKEELPQIGHQYADTAVDATCTERGYIHHECQNKDCTAAYNSDYSAALGHAWDKLGNCSRCEETCKHEYVNGACKHCHAVENVTYPEIAREETFTLTVAENEESTITLYYSDNGTLLKVKYSVLRFYQSDSTTNGDTKTVNYTVGGIMTEFYLADGTAVLDTFSAGEGWIGHEVSGSAKANSYRGTATRVYDLTDNGWVLKDKTENVTTELYPEPYTTILYFYMNADTGEVSDTGHTDGRSETTVDTQEINDPKYGLLYAVTTTETVYCSLCGAEAHKSVIFAICDENENALEYTVSEYIMVDGVETCVSKYVGKGDIIDSKIVEGERYNIVLSQEYLYYLVNGESFLNQLYEYTYGENHCSYTIKTTINGVVTEDEEEEHYYSAESYELIEGAKTCGDGVRRSRTCLSCGESVSEIVYYHASQVPVETIDLSKYGCAHGGQLFVYKCICGLQSYSYISDNGCNYVRTEDSIREDILDENGNPVDAIWHFIQTSTCTECDCSITTDEYSIYSNCRRTDYNIISIDGEEVYRVETDAGVNHRSSSYQNVEEECYSEIVDGKLILHEVMIQICNDCQTIIGKINASHFYDDENGSHLMKSEQLWYVPSGDGMALDRKSVHTFTLAESHYLPGFVYELITESITYHYSHDNAETPMAWDKSVYLYEGANNCSYTLYRSDSAGDSYQAEYYEEHARFDYRYVLRNPEGTCLDGIDEVQICVECGEICDQRPWTEGQHFTPYDDPNATVYYFNDYGHTCGSKFTVSSCICGATSIWNWDLNQGVGGSSHWETVDGIEHVIFEYTCEGDCEGTITRDQYTEKDAFCNTVEYETFSWNGIMAFKLTNVIGQSHNTTAKELPDECSDVTDPQTGMRTITIAREHYCTDCKASIQKTVMVDTYDQNGYLVEEIIRYYNFNATDSGETLAILNRINVDTYAVAACTFDPTYTRTYITTSLLTCYNEDGSELYWERGEYSYNNGNYCNYHAAFTDSNGGTWGRSGSRHTADRKTVYHLTGASCTDGVSVYGACYDCGTEEYIDTYFHHVSELVRERIDLAQYGSVCGSELVVYGCPCGDSSSVSFEGKCEFTLQEQYSYWNEDETVMYTFSSYACPVTDPHNCGFSYTVLSWYGPDERCHQVQHNVYTFGASKPEDEGVFRYSYTVDTEKVMHTVEITETQTETGYVKSESCTVCGMTVEKVTVDNYNIVTESYRYYADGALSSKTTAVGTIFFEESWYAGYRELPSYVRDEFYDIDGTLSTWQETTYTYPLADENNYCYCKVVYSNQANPDGYRTDIGVRHVEGMYWTTEADCVPGRPVTLQCVWCGETEQNLEDSLGHRYRFDDDLGLYVCRICGLESENGVNGDVIFADYTLTEGSGNAEYIIGYRNQYEGDYIWSVSLVIEGREDFVMLDIQPREVGNYRLILDAEAIAKAAKEYAGACEYMVRVAFVPTGAAGQVDFAITLDPHVLVLNTESSSIVTDPCTERGTYVYDCLLCDAKAIKEITYGGTHEFISENSSSCEIDSNNRQIKTETVVESCKNCDYKETIVSKTVYSPNGMVLERGTDRFQNGVLYRSNSTVYDHAAGTYTCTSKGTTGNIYVYVRDIATDLDLIDITKDADGNELHRYTYDYTQDQEGNYYVTFSKYEDADGYWSLNEYSYDFDKQICTTTFTDSDGAYNVTEAPLRLN